MHRAPGRQILGDVSPLATGVPSTCILSGICTLSSSAACATTGANMIRAHEKKIGTKASKRFMIPFLQSLSTPKTAASVIAPREDRCP